MSAGPLAPVVKGVAAGIGLASEYRQHRREQKAAKSAAAVTVTSIEPTVSDTSRPTAKETHEPKDIHSDEDIKAAEVETVEIADDEKQWELDEAQDELISSDERKPKAGQDPTKMAKRFTDAHPPVQNLKHEGLPLPVVLPQRRPKDRTRGFIRAYAPDLQSCDIDQETFLEFLETFNQATLASPWLDAINLASFAFVTMPFVISQAASIAIAIAVDITKNMQSRHRYNHILDQMNDDFFRPRGLYALVLTWNPEAAGMKIGVNLNETIAKNMTAPQGLQEKVKHSLRPSMQNTMGVAFSQTAPLVFPALDSLVNNQTPEAKDFKQKVKTTKSFIADYLDRRAQAAHAGEHPDSELAAVGPRPVFTSKYSDPNNPSNNGSIISLVTGGKLAIPQHRGLIRSASGLIGQRIASYRSRGSAVQCEASDLPPSYEQDAYQQQYQTTQFSGTGFGAGGLGARRGQDGLITGGIKKVFQHVSLCFSSSCNILIIRTACLVLGYCQHADR